MSGLFARKYDAQEWKESIQFDANFQAFFKLTQFFTADEVRFPLGIAVDLYSLALEFEIDGQQIQCIREHILAHSHAIDMIGLHRVAKHYKDNKVLFHTAVVLLRDPFATFKLPVATFHFNRRLFNADSDYDKQSKIVFRMSSHAVLTGLEIAIPWLNAKNAFEYKICIDETTAPNRSFSLRQYPFQASAANDNGMINANFEALFIDPKKVYSITLVETHTPYYVENVEQLKSHNKLFLHYSRTVNGCRLSILNNADGEQSYSRFSKLQFYPLQYR